MSHQRYPSVDPAKEPHAVSLKVLRLSRPSLVSQHPLLAPTSSLPSSTSSTTTTTTTPTIPASLAYQTDAGTNPDPFLLTPILNLPPSFGSAYVGEVFSCTLCANHEVPGETLPALTAAALEPNTSEQTQGAYKKKSIRDVRIEAEMKTPGSSAVQQLSLTPSDPPTTATAATGVGVSGAGGGGVDLEVGQTLQKIVNFDLKEEGNHVLAVTVSYYEATETSGRTRTFRKLYQFVCKGALIVRTKVGPMTPTTAAADTAAASEERNNSSSAGGEQKPRKWVMEAQLENCSEDAMQLSRVLLELDPGVHYRDCNWEATGSPRPMLQPGEIQQCCFIVAEDEPGSAVESKDGRIVFGVLGIGWRSEMGNKGYLATGKLGTRAIR